MTADYEAIRTRQQAIGQIVPLLEAIRSIAEIAYRRAEQRLPPLARYAAGIDDQLAGLGEEAGAASKAGDGKVSRSLLIVISSERGLCGSFNQRLIQDVLAELARRRSTGEDVLVCCIGRRGQLLLAESKQHIAYSGLLTSFSLPTYLEIERIAVEILDLMEDESCDQLSVMYNAPTRRFQYHITQKQLFPVEPATSNGSGTPPEVKPADDVEELFTQLVTERVLIDLYQAAIESSISEELARVASMRLAVDNAKHLMEELSLEANRAYQVSETNALLEIISGSEMSARPG